MASSAKKNAVEGPKLQVGARECTKEGGALLSSELLPSFKALTWILRCSASLGNGVSEDQEVGKGAQSPRPPWGMTEPQEWPVSCATRTHPPVSTHLWGFALWGSLPWCLFSGLHPLLLILTLLTEGPVSLI